MSKIKIEGMKDDLDVVAIVKAFEAFKDGIQLVADKAKELIVDLQFESSMNKTTHYTFKQDEAVTLKDVGVNPENKKITFACVFGANDKRFYNDEAELINVITIADAPDTGEAEETKKSLADHIKEEFSAAFPSELRVNSITALQAMVRNNPPLVDILNEPSKFLENIEAGSARVGAYAKLVKFGRY